MAIDGPEWGKCLVNKASGRYSAGFRELNSLPHSNPCPLLKFLFSKFFVVVNLLVFAFEDLYLLAFTLTGKAMLFFKIKLANWKTNYLHARLRFFFLRYIFTSSKFLTECTSLGVYVYYIFQDLLNFLKTVSVCSPSPVILAN
jgi:hypothetical protein